MKSAKDIAQWVIDNRYSTKDNKVSDVEMYYEIVTNIEALLNNIPERNNANIEAQVNNKPERNNVIENKTCRMNLNYPHICKGDCRNCYQFR